VHGLLITAVCVAAFWLAFRGNPEHAERARSITFCVAAFSQLFFAIGCRSDRAIAPRRGFFANPALILAILVSAGLQLAAVTLPVAREVFDVQESLADAWLQILGLSLIPVTVIELTKMVRYGFR
jgi:Ca2+-transporting ATPase